MAANIITQFVLKQLGKKSLRNTGIATLNKASDPIVQSNVRNIEIQLKNLGINPEDLTSTDDVLKALNYHNALMNQHLKQQFKGLGLGKGIKSLEKKKTPVEERPLLKDSPEAIAKIKAENKAAVERLRAKKTTVEDFTKDDDWDPSGMASGGIAGQLHLNQGGRIGYESGKKVWPPKGPNPDGSFDPGSLPKNFINKMPLMDPRLRDLIKEYKKRKGLAEILGV